MSMIYSPVNIVMLYGVALETAIFICIVYIPGVNTWFGARPVDILNLGYFLFIIIIECLDCHIQCVYSVGKKCVNTSLEISKNPASMNSTSLKQIPFGELYCNEYHKNI